MTELMLRDINFERLRFAVKLLNKYTAEDGNEALEDLEALIVKARRGEEI